MQALKYNTRTEPPKGKAVTWLTPDEVETIWNHWNFLPLEDDQLDRQKLLDHTDLEVG